MLYGYNKDIRRKLIRFLIPLVLLFACLGFAACKEELPKKLSAPQNLRTEGKALVWDEVEYADGYSVWLENREYLTGENRYDLSELNDFEIYQIEVMAYSDRGITHSESVPYRFAGRFALPTEGLQYRLWGGDAVIVTGFAYDENGVCVIPETYKGYRVSGLGTDKPSGSSGSGSSVSGFGIPQRNPQEECIQTKCLCLPYALVESFVGLGGDAFENLEEIVVGEYSGEGDARYIVEGNCIVDTWENAVVFGCMNSEIPAYVTKIGAGAYAGRNIASFTVPDRITEIGSNAFAYCALLQSCELPENFTVKHFNLFAESGLTEITVPEGVVSLDSAFTHCTSLKEVHLPESVEVMRDTFYGCTSLERLVIPPKVKELSGTFKFCRSLKEVVLHEGIEKIVDEAFGYCNSLQSVIIPESVTEIGEWAFVSCTSLQSVKILGSDVSIGKFAFSSCRDLETVELPKEVSTNFMHGVFRLCNSLQSVIIPEGVSLTGRLFQECKALKWAVVPKTPITIGTDTFDGCTAFSEVYYAGTEEEWAENVKVVEIGNDTFLSATRYYYSETAPEGEGNFWHYVDGVPEKWA